MGDADLAAFFARKANKKKEKKKKSGIINIEDVGQHLERRANIEVFIHKLKVLSVANIIFHSRFLMTRRRMEVKL